MYTENYDNKYEDEDYEQTTNGDYSYNNRGLIIKIIIIIACVILLIWLISVLRKNNNAKGDVVYDPAIHAANVEKVRLASEKYFFLDNHMPKANNYSEISLGTLQNIGYVGEIVDASDKVCNGVNSYVKLEDTINSYVLTIKLACSTNDKVETYNYSKLDKACLNCDGKTYMEGEKNNNSNENNNSNNQEKETKKDSEYSCDKWSDWTTEKVSDSSLEERTRTLVRGVQYGTSREEITYGPWTEYVNTPIIPNDNIEIEAITQRTKGWSENKTTEEKVVESDTIKLISKDKVSTGNYSYCPKGYTKKDGKCYSDETIKGDLTYLQYNSGEYLVTNRPCEAIRNEKDSNGKYINVYKNCVYKKVTSLKKGTSTKSIYTYQELVDQDITLYRARAKYVNIVKTDDIYTDEYYEENKLPSGYVKLVGSEKVEYSYKLKVCEK